MQKNILPIKKSNKQIKSYLEHGKEFGKVLKQIYDSIEDFKYPIEIQKYFKELSNKYNSMIDFPFRDEINGANKLYGSAICVSVNDSVAHSKPNRKTFKQGDVISIDFGWKLEGLMYDSAFTKEYKTELEWINAPYIALNNIIKRCPKNTKEISKIIEATAIEHNLDIVTALAGHGIGEGLHEPPRIHNAVGEFVGTKLFNNFVFCAEPIYSQTRTKRIQQTNVYIDSDGWTIKTEEEIPTTHWETMFYIKNNKIIDIIGITEWNMMN